MRTNLDVMTDALLLAHRTMNTEALRELLSRPDVAELLSSMPSSLPQELMRDGGQGTDGLDGPGAWAVIASTEAAYYGG